MARVRVAGIRTFVEGSKGRTVHVGVDVHKRSYSVALLRPAGVWKEWTAPSSPKALDRRFHFETIIEKRISLVCSKTHPFFGRSNAKPNELRGLR